MKHIFTCVLVCILSLELALSQNALFISFDNDYEMVISHLQRFYEGDFSVEKPQELIRVIHNGGETKYEFSNGLLYKISMTKHYKKGKTAESAFEGCFKFFETIEVSVIEQYELNNQKCFIGAKLGTIYELILTYNDEEPSLLTLSSKQIYNTPPDKLDYYDYLISKPTTDTMTGN